MAADPESDSQVVTATLQQMGQKRVTQALLLSTGAGKAVKVLSKSKTAQVSEAAQQVVKVWKCCILQAAD